MDCYRGSRCRVGGCQTASRSSMLATSSGRASAGTPRIADLITPGLVSTPAGPTTHQGGAGTGWWISCRTCRSTPHRSAKYRALLTAKRVPLVGPAPLAAVQGRRAGAGTAGRSWVGKTALLEYLSGRASDAGCQVVAQQGRSKWSCAFASLHQLCASLFGPGGRHPKAAAGCLANHVWPDEQARCRTGSWSALLVLDLLSEVAAGAPLVFKISRFPVARRYSRGSSGSWPAGSDRSRSPWCSGRDTTAEIGRLRGRRKSRASPPSTRRRCWGQWCVGIWTLGRATRSSPRRAATRWHCWVPRTW